MSKIIQLVQDNEVESDRQLITIDQYYRKRELRRKRVAKRMCKRFPLFAVEFMQQEFPGYTIESFEEDIKRRKKSASKRKGKSQLRRQGRYPLMEKAMSNYHLTGDQKYLEEAQEWRNKLFLPFEVEFRLGRERRILTFPSTTSVNFVRQLGTIKFNTWEELDAMLQERLKYSHLS